MRPRTLLILAGLVGASIAFIWLFERDLPSSDEREALAKRIVTLEADEVERLTVEWGDRVVELQRQSLPQTDAATGWNLVRPVVARADGDAVDALVGRLTGLEKQRTLEEVRRSDVGLESPRGRVTLVATAGSTVLEVGAAIPASSNMTLAIAGLDEVFVVRDAIWTELTKEPGEWRDKALFVGARDDIESLVLRHRDEVTELVSRDDAFWLESPMTDIASAPDAGSLLDALTGLRAESFIDQPLPVTASGLDASASSVEVNWVGGGEPWRIELGRSIEAEPASAEAEEGAGGSPETTTRYARVGGQLVTIGDSLDVHLARPADDWRSLEWVTSEPYAIDEIHLSDAGGDLEILRDGNDWLRNGERIGYVPATELLYALGDVKAERVIDEPEGSLGPAQVTITLASDPGEAETGEPAARETAWVYAPRADGVPTRVSSRQAVLLLSPQSSAEILDKIEALRVAEPEPRPSEDTPTADEAG